MLSFLESYKNADAAISLIGEGFDMLEEDYEEESFFAAVRRGYWQRGRVVADTQSRTGAHRQARILISC